MPKLRPALCALVAAFVAWMNFQFYTRPSFWGNDIVKRLHAPGKPLPGRNTQRVRMTYPTQPAVGCARPKLPLHAETHLRLVPGDVRRYAAPIVWRSDAERRILSRVFLQVGSSGSDKPCVVELAEQGDLRPNYWLDFVSSAPVESAFDLSVVVYTTDGKLPFMEKSISDGAIPDALSAVGYAALLPQDFQGTDVGSLTRPLTNSLGKVIGEMSFDYVLTKACNAAADSADSSSLFDPARVPRFVGHRGLGSSKTGPAVAENTIKSFKLATSGRHVNHVELDIQLSSDGVPVLYHNWAYPVPPHELYVHNVSSDVLTSLPAPSPQGQATVPSQNVTTLSSVLKGVPRDVGLLIEIKYPPPNVQARETIPYPDHNAIVDATLRVVFSEGGSDRSIVFLSFDADVCSMLRMKQAKYPVFFLHCEQRDGFDECDDADPRTVNVGNGVRYANSQGFAGMVMFADMVLEDETLAKRTVGSGLSLLTYGSKNKSPSIVEHQLRKLGVDGVIADHVVQVADAVLPHL